MSGASSGHHGCLWTCGPARTSLHSAGPRGLNVVPVPLRLLIDDPARANGVGDFGEVANVGSWITVEHDDIGVKSLLYPPLPRGLEIGGRVGCQRSKHIAKRQSAAP